MNGTTGHNSSEEIRGRELYFEKVSRLFRISPILFGVLIFGIWSVGGALISHVIFKPLTFFEVCNSLVWWIGYSSLIVFLLHLKTKYSSTIESIDLPEGEQQKLINSFPNESLRIFLVMACTLWLMVFQIAFRVLVLKVEFHVVYPVNFVFWEAFLPFCGLAVGEYFAELIEMGALPWRIRNKVRIDVLHFDYHGGLKVIAELFTHSIATVSLAIVLFSLAAQTSRLAGVSPQITSSWLLSDVLGGTIIIILCFAIPQLFLSKRMKQIKRSELKRYYRNMIPIEASDRFEEAVIHLHNVTLYQEIQKMHEYPFSIGQLEKVTAIAILPAIEKLLPLLLVYLK